MDGCVVLKGDNATAMAASCSAAALPKDVPEPAAVRVIADTLVRSSEGCAAVPGDDAGD